MRPSSFLKGVLLAACFAVHAEEAVVETFKPSKLTDAPKPRYPAGYAARNKEGWVTLAMMVDPQGKPYDIIVANSSGDPNFEKEAIRAAKKFTYDPAVMGDTAIDSGAAVSISFALSGRPGASRRFIHLYRLVNDAIHAEDRARADELLGKIDVLEVNLYEEAYRQLVLFSYFSKWGSQKEQLLAIERATYIDEDNGFLPDSLLISALSTRMHLEARLQRIRDAMVTADTLLRFDLSEAQHQAVTGLRGQLQNALESNHTFHVVDDISDAYRFGHRLARRSFSFQDIDGDIAELRLHCEKAFLGFAYEQDMRYTVPESAGNCLLTAIGDPGTTFTLVEHPSP